MTRLLAPGLAVLVVFAAPHAFAEKTARENKPAARAAATQPVLSILTPTESVPAGSVITVNLVALNPVDYDIGFDAPDTLDGELAGKNAPVAVTLLIDPKDDRGLDTIGARRFVSYTYHLAIPSGALGDLVLSLREPAPVRALLSVSAQTAPAVPVSSGEPPAFGGAVQPAATATAPLDSLPPPLAITKVKRSFLNNFATYEPIYFIYGPDTPAAKFQFSFMYRVLADEGYLAKKFPMLRGLSFAYTQRSLWDIDGDSSPFYDTSYMPEIFCAYMTPAEKTMGGGFNWLGLQAGAGHESNGRDGPDSRSMNKVTARALFSFGNLDGWRILFGPKIWVYVGDMSDNPDLNDYRGYGDLTMSLGKNDSLNLAVYLRAGHGLKRGAVQVDLTYPLDSVFRNFAGYFLIQYWNGYGESLLHYNERSETVRFGVSLVR